MVAVGSVAGEGGAGGRWRLVGVHWGSRGRIVVCVRQCVWEWKVIAHACVCTHAHVACPARSVCLCITAAAPALHISKDHLVFVNLVLRLMTRGVDVRVCRHIRRRRGVCCADRLWLDQWRDARFFESLWLESPNCPCPHSSPCRPPFCRCMIPDAESDMKLLCQASTSRDSKAQTEKGTAYSCP